MSVDCSLTIMGCQSMVRWQARPWDSVNILGQFIIRKNKLQRGPTDTNVNTVTEIDTGHTENLSKSQLTRPGQSGQKSINCKSNK